MDNGITHDVGQVGLALLVIGHLGQMCLLQCRHAANRSIIACAKEQAPAINSKLSLAENLAPFTEGGEVIPSLSTAGWAHDRGEEVVVSELVRFELLAGVRENERTVLRISARPSPGRE